MLLTMLDGQSRLVWTIITKKKNPKFQIFFMKNTINLFKMYIAL